MINSMTGYGSGTAAVDGISVSMELKSVNNRYLDISCRLPKTLLFAEEPLKKKIAESVSRGKLDVYITVDTSSAETYTVALNEALADAYVQALEQLNQRYSLNTEISAFEISRYPDVLTVQREETDRERLLDVLMMAVTEAMQSYNTMRASEGNRLKTDMLGKLTALETMVAQVEERSPDTVREYRERLYVKLQELLQDRSVDETRILQESALYADKVAVDEECVRMRSHIAQFRDILNQDSPVGKKLDFLIQEMNREANTTGSKCQDSEIAETVIAMKSEIEKLREQVQNIE